MGSTDSPLSLMGLLGTTGLGLFAGRLLKRKNDYSPMEVKDLVSRRLAEERDKVKV